MKKIGVKSYSDYVKLRENEEMSSEKLADDHPEMSTIISLAKVIWSKHRSDFKNFVDTLGKKDDEIANLANKLNNNELDGMNSTPGPTPPAPSDSFVPPLSDTEQGEI